MWKQPFHNFFNCVDNSSAKNLAFDVSYDNSIKVLHEEVKDSIRYFDCSKSCGLDGVDAEHLKYSSEHRLPLLSMCFIGLLVHGILPSSMISVILVPVIKDKTGKIDSKDNYRPIELASVV